LKVTPRGLIKQFRIIIAAGGVTYISLLIINTLNFFPQTLQMVITHYKAPRGAVYIAMRDLELSYEELFPLDTTKSKKGKFVAMLQKDVAMLQKDVAMLQKDVAMLQTDLAADSSPHVMPSNSIRPKEPVEKEKESEAEAIAIKKSRYELI
jgi:hypothetical protein